MFMNGLSKRLETVAGLLINNQPVADIGADHAWLSIYLIKNRLVPRVIIGELGNGPLQRAAQAVEASGLKEQIELRQGNGLQVLQAGEVASVAIAGLGGDTILEILAYNWDKSASFKRLVLQPMSRSGALRREMAIRGWSIIYETVLQEDGRFFIIMAVEPDNVPYTLSDLEIDIGPLLLKADNSIKKAYIEACLMKYRRVYNGLNHSQDEQNREMARAYADRIKRLEAVLGAKS